MAARALERSGFEPSVTHEPLRLTAARGISLIGLPRLGAPGFEEECVPRRHVGNDLFFRKCCNHNDLKGDPPNAVLIAFEEKSHPTSTAMVLNHPHADGNTISYDVPSFERILPATGAEASLFIDESNGSCNRGYDLGDPGLPAMLHERSCVKQCHCGRTFPGAARSRMESCAFRLAQVIGGLARRSDQAGPCGSSKQALERHH